MKIRTFHINNYLNKKGQSVLPLICIACGHIIQENETYESTYHGRNIYCQECSNKPILVYPLKMRRSIKEKRINLLERAKP